MNSAPVTRCWECGGRVVVGGQNWIVGYPYDWVNHPDGGDRFYPPGQIRYAHKVCPSVEPPEPPDGATAR